MSKPLRTAYSRKELSEALNKWMIDLWGANRKKLSPDEEDTFYRDNGLIYKFICDHFPTRKERTMNELRRRFDAKKAAEEKARLENEAAEARSAEAKAKAEAEAAKTPTPTPPAMHGMLPPSDLPAPPKIGGIPVGRTPEESLAVGITVEAEWEMFAELVREAFGLIRIARENLTHQSNQVRAAAFAEAVGHAWKSAKP